MRGTPFLKSGFHLGLNTIDSPYTLAEGESRDCLNVVSTERGAIRKRNGCTVFASAAAAYFPTLGVTDSFERANESPLSNAGKWTSFKNEAEVGTQGQILENEWQPKAVEFKRQGALWNASQANPAASVELVAWGENAELVIAACVNEEGKNCYTVKLNRNKSFEEGTLTITRRLVGTSQTLATTETKFATGDLLGISVRLGVVTAWRHHSGVWTVLASAVDSNLTEGLTGFLARSNSGIPRIALRNFSFGEIAAPIESEFTSLLPCVINGTNYLIGSAGTKLYSITEHGEITQIGSGFTNGARWSIIQGPSFGDPLQKTGGPVYLSNGKDKPQYWTGAAKNTAVHLWEGASGEYEEPVTKAKVKGYEDALTKEHVPNGKYMVIAGNRVWTAGISDDPTAVRFSGQTLNSEGGGFADPTSWPAENVVRFDAEDGRPITGLGLVGPYVLVFKERKCWTIHDLDNGENRKLSDKIGTPAFRSIVETEQGTFFLTHDQGVYLTNGSTLKEMSYNVRPNLVQKANGQKLELAAAGYLNNHYYVSYPAEGSVVNNRTLDYDVVLKSWWLHDLATNQWVHWELPEEPKLYVIRPKELDGVLTAFVPGIYQDAGFNYAGAEELSAYWKSPWEPFAYYIFRHRIKAPFLKKRCRMVFFDGSGEIIPIVYKNFNVAGERMGGVPDNTPENEPELPVVFKSVSTEKWGEGEGVWGQGEAIWGAGAETHAARIYAPGIARVWGVGFGNNSAEPFEVDSYAYMVQFRKS